MKYFLLTFTFLFISCRTQRVVSDRASTDSTTSITHRSVAVVIKPATLTDSVNLYEFTHIFSRSAVGAVIAQEKSKRVSYTIRKTSANDFDVEAVAEKVDTTVTVADTQTLVVKKERVVVVQAPTLIGRMWQGVKDYALFAVLLLVVVLFILKKVMG